MTRRTSSYWAAWRPWTPACVRPASPACGCGPSWRRWTTRTCWSWSAAGHLPWAVVDDHKARAWQRALPELTLREDLVLRSGGEIAWALRKGSPQLAASLASFTKATAKGTEFGNIVANRYLVAADQLRGNDAADRKRFLDLLALFRKWGERYRFDPLLLAAQGYQESGLDQSRRSSAGAVGIMQIRPQTAADPNVDVARIDRLENNIHAGAKYLRHLIDVYFADPAHRRARPHAAGARRLQCRPVPDRRAAPACRQARPRPEPLVRRMSSFRPRATSAARPWPMSATS